MKPANLTSSLLTRKGRASPALVAPLPPAPAAPPPLLRSKANGLACPVHVRPVVPRVASAKNVRSGVTNRRIHTSLRLDPGRHLRLRLEAARTGRSLQSLLTEALDRFLERDVAAAESRYAAFGQGLYNDSRDLGNRREPAQIMGVEADDGTPRSP